MINIPVFRSRTEVMIFRDKLISCIISFRREINHNWRFNQAYGNKELQKKLDYCIQFKDKIDYCNSVHGYSN